MDEWFSTIKLEFVKFSFPSKIDTTQQDILTFFESLENEEFKLSYITKFIRLDQYTLPFMIEKTRHWKYNFTSELYKNLYRSCQQKRTKFICISYLLSHQKHEQDMIDELFRLMDEEHDYEAYDILQRFRHMLTIPQQRRVEQWFQDNRFGYQHMIQNDYQAQQMIRHDEHTLKNSQRTVYHDSQNVHHHEINDSVWKNIQILTSSQQSVDSESYSLLKTMFRHLTHKQREALSRMENDHSIFSKNNYTICFQDILHHVSYYILQQSEPHQTELIQRFKEELDDMSGTCASGHLSRIMNCLIGFHPDIEMNIGETHRVFSILNHTIQTRVIKDQNSDDILIDMINPSTHGIFYAFLLKNKEEIMQSIQETTRLSRQQLSVFISESWAKMYPNTANPFQTKKKMSCSLF